MMARVFSMSFEFRGNHYTALVSIRQQDHDLSCVVRYVNKELHCVLPGDRLMFSLGGGLVEPAQLPNELAQSLVNCTTDAIYHYIQEKD